MSQVHDAFPKKNLYFTEQMVTGSIDAPRPLNTAQVRRLIIGATRNWSRNVILWNLAADPENNPHTNDGGCGTCQGAITIDGSKYIRNLAYYVMAHASKFVRPGSVRIGSNNLDTLANVAFKTPDGKKVLIVHNSATTPQTFNIGYRGQDGLGDVESRVGSNLRVAVAVADPPNSGSGTVDLSPAFPVTTQPSPGWAPRPGVDAVVYPDRFHTWSWRPSHVETRFCDSPHNPRRNGIVGRLLLYTTPAG